MATKTLKDIFEIISNELAVNTALTTWCQSSFGIQPTIIFGADEIDLPQPTGLEIHIIPGARSRTRQFAYRSYGLTISAIIKDSSAAPPSEEGGSPESGGGETGEIVPYTLDCLDKIDQFISLIEEAVIPVLNKNGIVVTPSEGDEDVIAYPHTVAFLNYTLEVPSRLPL